MSEREAEQPEPLLAKARAGDDLARGRLLELYRNYLTLLARLQIGSLLRGKVDDSDLAQEVFLKAHRDFGEFRGHTEGELVAWLRQILVWTLANQVRHYLGTRRRDPRLEQRIAAGIDRSSQALDNGLVAASASPSRQVARREQTVLLADALAGLPAEYREAIVLRHLEGLPFPDVAARMGRTVDSVKKLWARGLSQLRRSLGGEQ
jgi:RNA polymerase sigma-70 factor, ECF subfamily